jgi:hypothetical protein
LLTKNKKQGQFLLVGELMSLFEVVVEAGCSGGNITHIEFTYSIVDSTICLGIYSLSAYTLL